MRILVDGQTLGTPELQRGIGKVFLEILYHMVDGDISHDWYIAVRDPAHFELLHPRLRRWMSQVILPPLSASGKQIEWCKAYGCQLESVARTVGADIYWNPNPLMPNVHFPLGFRSTPRVVTLYDLIPRLMPERFRNAWGEPLWQDYLARCEELAAEGCHLLAISAATARDFEKEFPLAGDRIDVATLASDYSLFWPYIQGDRLSDPPYVLYVGGFDPRKNMDNALRAFAAFVKSFRDEKIRFKVVCAYDRVVHDAYFALAKELDVDNRLDLLGYVEDEELGYLFRGASVFFFPSLYEGFGLPVLDALACGLPVVASSTSSIPEVGGAHVLYCDPTDIEDMAHALREAWQRRDPTDPRRAAAVDHARGFRWEQAAQIYLSTFDKAAGGRKRFVRMAPTRKPRAAYLSPWPPQKTGIADYSYQIMPELLARMDVTLFADTPEECLPVVGLNIQSIGDYSRQAADFDGAIYHLGNGLTHLNIYEQASRVPGVIVLHDFNIHPFFQHGFLGNVREAIYEETFKEYGPDAVAEWKQFKSTGRRPDIWRYPMSHSIARRSLVTVVHNRWTAAQLGDVGKVMRVHHGARIDSESPDQERRTLLDQLYMEHGCFWIGVFGFVNQHKRVDSVLAAAGDLQRRGYPVRVLVVGEVNDSRVDLSALAKRHGIAAILRQEGYVTSDRFVEYMKAVDMVANLRYPTMGESSGSLFHALAWGKPTLVSDFGPFLEMPDSVAWKADPLQDEVEQLTLAIEAMLKSPRVRNELSTSGRRFVSDKASFSRVADVYLRAIEESRDRKPRASEITFPHTSNN